MASRAQIKFANSKMSYFFNLQSTMYNKLVASIICDSQSLFVSLMLDRFVPSRLFSQTDV